MGGERVRTGVNVSFYSPQVKSYLHRTGVDNKTIIKTAQIL